MKFSFQKTFYGFAVSAAFFIFMYYGKPVLISVSTALLISFILYPIAGRLEHYGLGRITSAMLSMVAAIGIVGLLVYLFSTQIIQLTGEVSTFEDRLVSVFRDTLNFLNKKVPLIPTIEKEDLVLQWHNWLKESGFDFMSATVNNTTTLFSGLLMVIVYTFLLLIYRSGLKGVMIESVKKKSKEKMAKMIKDIQQVGQHYLLGMSIMIAILGTANSLILWIFQVDHPILFGFLAGLLSVIPYVGTTIGALLPVLYAFMTKDSVWIPLGIAGSFWIVQLIESNFLSPKIVGGNLSVNAFAAIISLIIGGYLWGIAGMALFLPLAAIFKVFCSYFDTLRPLSMLMGDNLYEIGNNKSE